MLRNVSAHTLTLNVFAATVLVLLRISTWGWDMHGGEEPPRELPLLVVKPQHLSSMQEQPPQRAEEPPPPHRASAVRVEEATLVKASEKVDGCPDMTDPNPGNNCHNQYTGTLHDRWAKGAKAHAGGHEGGPYVAMLQPVKEGTHAATMVELESGVIVMAWFTGVEGEAGVVIAVSRLQPGSKQWEQPSVVSAIAGCSNQNPTLFVDPATQNVHLLHTSQEGGKGQATASIVWLNSTDGGSTWSTPWKHPSFEGKRGPMTKGKILVKTSDTGVVEWLLPMYYTPVDYDLATHYSSMWRSYDGGQTWVDEVLMSEPGQYMVQPSVIWMPNAGGAMRAYFRDRHGQNIYYSDSKDGGRTWPKKAKKSKLPNNQSSIQVIVLRNGHILMAFNNQKCSPEKANGIHPRSSDGGLRCHRHPLSLALSIDGGETWGWVRDVEPGGRFDKVKPLRTPPRYQRYSYPALVQTRDDRIHVAFSYRKKAIKHVVIDEHWIENGPKSTGVFKGQSEAEKQRDDEEEEEEPEMTNGGGLF